MTTTATTLDVILGEVFDSRDLIELIDALEAVEVDDEDYDDAQAELARIAPFAEEIEQSAVDYRYGVGLIRDDYFEDYARELADDTGAVSANADWPNSFIDWPAAADALKMDYAAVEFEGTTWWVQ